MPTIALLDYLTPLLVYFGLLLLIVAAVVVVFWPWCETPLIALLEGVRDWRSVRRRRRDIRRATKRRRP